MMKRILKGIRRVLLGAVSLAGLAALLLLAGDLIVVGSAGRHIYAAEALPEGEWDCILILGCGVRPDGQPSPMLRDRLERGIELYEAGVSDKILVSGDHGSAYYNEVGRMKSYLTERGVPSEAIFMDHAGFSTYESMYRARDVFAVSSACVVTQRYHLYRAVYDGRALGLNAVGVAAAEVRYGGQDIRNIREIAARNKDLFFCLWKPEPTFLGEVVAIRGNGDDTNDGGGDLY